MTDTSNQYLAGLLLGMAVAALGLNPWLYVPAFALIAVAVIRELPAIVSEFRAASDDEGSDR